MNLFAPPTVDYCEKISNGHIARPGYALSTLAYYLVAFLILRHAKESKLAKYFGVMILTVASFSLIYDIRPIYLTQLFDLTGMLVIISFILFLDLFKLTKWSKQKLILALSVAILAGITAIVAFKGVAGDVVFGLFVLSEVMAQDLVYRRKLNHDYRFWVYGFLVFVLGFLFWIPDLTKTICAPIGLVDGRSLFHYCVAVSLYFLFIYYSKNEINLLHK